MYVQTKKGILRQTVTVTLLQINQSVHTQVQVYNLFTVIYQKC